MTCWDDGTVCTLSKSVGNTKLRGVAHILDDCSAIQRNLDRLVNADILVCVCQRPVKMIKGLEYFIQGELRELGLFSL